MRSPTGLRRGPMLRAGRRSSPLRLATWRWSGSTRRRPARRHVRAPRPVPRGEWGLNLSPAGTIEGRVVASDPRAASGLSLRLRTVSDASNTEAGTGGFARALTDEQGRFHVPAIAAGTLSLAFEPHPDLPFRGRFADSPSVAANAMTRVEVALKRAALIRGTVRERGNGAPVAGRRGGHRVLRRGADFLHRRRGAIRHLCRTGSPHALDRRHPAAVLLPRVLPRHVPGPRRRAGVHASPA